MKRQEIKDLMERGQLLCDYTNDYYTQKSCLVVHLWQHKSWIIVNNKIKSVHHKYLSNPIVIEGKSTYNPSPRSFDKVYELSNKYKTQYGLK